MGSPIVCVHSWRDCGVRGKGSFRFGTGVHDFLFCEGCGGVDFGSSCRSVEDVEPQCHGVVALSEVLARGRVEDRSGLRGSPKPEVNE